MNANLESAVLLRVVVGHLAEAMLDGPLATRTWAWSIAEELRRGGVDVADEARSRIVALGGSPAAWAPPKAETATSRVDALRSDLARHIAGAYVSGSDEQAARARELELAADNAGLTDIETRVDRLVLEAMRTVPSLRGAGGRIETHPF
jgi:hypothetical protein